MDTNIAVETDLEILLDQIRPQAILLDNVIMFPAVAKAGCPWVRIVSCAETEIPDPNVPPYLSGLSPGALQDCQAFRKAYSNSTRAAHQRYNAFRKARGLAQLAEGVFLESSEHLNVLLAPNAVRYDRANRLPPESYVYLDGCVRQEAQFESPEFPVADGPLVYTSFGSLGAISTDLIQKMIDTFATIPARFIVNVGGFEDRYDHIPDNVHLGNWFPQPSVVAKAALFIHHGGNNSFCEALYHGVPSLNMPYCWDGHDNAQRAQARGVGRCIQRANWTAETLTEAIAGLLKDADMHIRLKTISRQMQANSGTDLAAQAILASVVSSPTPA